MGTRNLTCVIKDGEFCVAQYGQWDGYPEGAGADILAFLKTEGNIDRLENRTKDLRFIPSDEWTRRLRAAGIGESITYNSEAERIFQSNFWQLDRNIGRKILDVIITTQGVVELDDSSAFAHDSLYCEWAYVVDFDRKVFEVYKGINKNQNANFGVFVNVPKTNESVGYTTVALMKSYPLNELPTLSQLKIDCDRS
jgi:hypothetical protein